MKQPLVFLLIMPLLVVGVSQTAWAVSQAQDAQDLAVDRALGGLEEGSRMLPPAAEPPSKAKPGTAISPRDVGTTRGQGVGVQPRGDRGADATGRSGTQAGGAGAGVGRGVEVESGAGSAPAGDTDTGSGGSGGIVDTGVGGESGGGEAGTGGGETESSGSGIHVDVDVDTSTGEVSGGVSVDEEPIVETEIDSGTDLGGATEPVTEDAGAALDADVVTDTTTIDASTEITEGELTIDVSAGTDTLGDDLLGSGNEDDPDNDADEEDTATDNADCTVVDPLSVPEECL